MPIFMEYGFPGGSEVKNLPTVRETLGSIPESGRSPGGANGNPLQYSCLEYSMVSGAWQTTVHGVTESDVTEHKHYAVIIL